MSGIDGTRTQPRTGRRALVGTVLLAGALFGAAQPAFAAPAPAPAVTAAITCGGMTEAQAIAAGYNTSKNAGSAVAVIIVGGPGPDWIVGSDFNDFLDGQGGDDYLCGRGGVDNLRGLSGDDSMWGGGGNDDIRGGVGADVGRGGTGLNVCDGSTETQIDC